MNKEKIYNQIDNFKKELAPKLRQSSIKKLETYTYYVNDTEAKDKSKFIKYLINEKLLNNTFSTILDLTFGSGNLTANIILENDISYDTLIFNDINKDKSNQNIITVMDKSKLSTLNILDKTNFKDINANLVILNPQISGDYEGDISKINNYENNLKDTIKYFFDNNSTIVFYGAEKNYSQFFQEKKFIRYISKNNQLYIVNNEFTENKCFEFVYNKFLLNNDCIESNNVENNNLNISKLINELNEIDLNNNIDGIIYEDRKKFKFSDDEKGKDNWQDFQYKNILFKGVPGTGKSRAIDTIINKKLNIKNEKKNILRINIHSASSNSDLMQGIGISSDNGKIKYSEKQGLILNIIERATFHPNQPFVLILEEIQENSLNELIGDLIYLIEDDKRAKGITADNEEYSYEELVNKLVDENADMSFVEIPYLVNDSTNYKKMIMPSNLFIFCTSNYRDDKKVIEDNLLRRFEVIEIYPKNQEEMDKDDNGEYYFKSKNISDFLESVNISILKVMQKNHEIHPDRFIIGHSIWQDVSDEKTFYKAFSKLITEFKDIREVEFENFKEIIKACEIPDNVDIKIETIKSYFELIKDIQVKIDYGFIS